MDKYWVLYNGHVFEMMQLAADDMDAMHKAAKDDPLVGIPIYWSAGKGVWPLPMCACVIVKQIAPENVGCN
jgi:hypothetical protein